MPRRRRSPRPPLDQFLRRRGRRRWQVTVAALVILLLLALADRRGWLLVQEGDWTRYHDRTFNVTRVVDGDTLDVQVPDGDRPTTRVRLWGIDTPEMASRQQQRPAEPGAEEATRLATDLAMGKSVTLRLQSHRLRDRYGRLLAYVILPGGDVLNEQLILAGWAHADDRFAHDEQTRYQMLQQQARLNRAGLWAAKPKSRRLPDGPGAQ